jgi:outer membrane receptor protein involved in Fe transport
MKYRFHWVALALAASATSLLAQERGAVRGTVTAPDAKAPISGARIAIATPARAAITDAKGSYILRDLAPGTYDLVVTAIGREAAHVSATVVAGQTATADASLKQGSIMLSSVMVSASVSPMEARNVAATVNTLSPEQVRTSPARETQDMLRELPGVELARTSSSVGGTAQIVSIRGVDEGRTAVLLDGIPLNDAWGEWIDWNRAPKGSIERVEVLEGGGANLYGNGAMGGVISLFSRPVTPGSYRFTADGASRSGKHLYGTVGVPLYGPLSLALSGDYADGAGYKLISTGAGPVDIESSSIRRNGMARLEYAPSSNFSAFLSGHLFSDDRHLGTAISQAIRTDGATDGGITYRTASSGAFALRGWDREMRETGISTSLLTVSGVARASERRTSVAHIPSYDRGLSAAWNKANVGPFTSIGAGADYRYMSGFYDQQDYANTAANGATTHIQSGGVQSLSGAFVSGLLAPSDQWRVEISARVDNWSNNDGYANEASGTTKFDDKSRSAFSPRIGVKYQALSTLAFHGAFYKAFRAPNLAELYRKQVSATTISLPNPGLKPEYATGVEAGLDWQPAAWIQLKGTVFRAAYDDFNTFVTTSAQVGSTPATRQRQNVQKARSLGGEVYLALRPIDGLDFSGSLNYDDARTTDLGPIAPTALVFVGARVARVPMQRATLRGSYDSQQYGTLTLLGRYEGSNSTFGNSFVLPEFGVLDASYTRELFRGVSIFAGMENVFDRKYNVSQAGTLAAPIVTLGLPRTVRIGVDLIRY